MKPFISIILATYNRIKTIDRAVNSVLNQDFKSWELIIIDDGSKDNTVKYLRTIINKNENKIKEKIKIVKRKHKGAVEAVNAGIKFCKGKYITFIGSDDAYLKNHLSHHSKLIKNRPEVDLFYGGVKVIGPKTVPDVEHPGKRINISKTTPGGTFFIKNSVFKKHGGFPNLPIGEDHQLFLQLKKAGYKTQKLRMPTYLYYRTEPDEITKNF